jgi:arabinose-5-phosphate isomerase
VSKNRKPSLVLAREVLDIEATAVRALGARLGDSFIAAVELMLDCRGRVAVSGIGKSGHIARKFASTLASTGTPALFVHPAEASHGDLGMITRDDVFVAISYTGESEELTRIVPVLKRLGTKMIAMTGYAASTLGGQADVCLDTFVEKEACPLNLAPTASTTATLALGDALALALLDARGFTAEDFARSHPGGTLGRRLILRVSDVMRSSTAIPVVSGEVALLAAMLEISQKGMGMTAVVDDAGALEGIFTDGDLRRAIERNIDLRATPIRAVMTRSPRTISEDALAVQAVQMMDEHRITELLVVAPDNRLCGALNMHDLLRAKVY